MVIDNLLHPRSCQASTILAKYETCATPPFFFSLTYLVLKYSHVVSLDLSRDV